MTSLLLKAGRIVTMDPARRVIRDGAVRIDGSRITAVLDSDDLRALPVPAENVVDAPHATVIPGFIQTHLHLCQTLVLEVEIQQTRSIKPRGQTVGGDLPEERGLPRATHADDRDRFPLYTRNVGVTPGERRERG